jgi:hypothetical protein
MGQLMFLIIRHVVPSTSATRTLPSFEAALMSTVYEEQKDEDGFLYLAYMDENMYGND